MANIVDAKRTRNLTDAEVDAAIRAAPGKRPRCGGDDIRQEGCDDEHTIVMSLVCDSCRFDWWERYRFVDAGAADESKVPTDGPEYSTFVVHLVRDGRNRFWINAPSRESIQRFTADKKLVSSAIRTIAKSPTAHGHVDYVLDANGSVLWTNHARALDGLVLGDVSNDRPA